MSRIQSKITWHLKSQENLNLCGRRQSIDVYTEITPILGLSDKDFKAAIIKRLHKVRAKTPATDRKIVSARDGRYEKKNEWKF